MHYVLPAARGLRQLYALSSDRLWFTVAVLVSLLVATEVPDLSPTASPSMSVPR